MGAVASQCGGYLAGRDEGLTSRRRYPKTLLPLSLLSILVVHTPVHAQSPDDEAPAPLHPWRMLLQTGLALGGGTVWYWMNYTEMNAVDSDLSWDLPSWKLKLTSFDAVRFDANEFTTNARAHTRAGGAYYLIGRANGFGALASLGIDFGASAFWEYVVEFREKVSLNDMVANTVAGPAIAEPLLQIGRFFQYGRPTWWNKTLAFAFAPFDGLNGWLDDRPWVGGDEVDGIAQWSSERFHRFALLARYQSLKFSGVTRFEKVLGAEADVVLTRGYGRPGSWERWIRPGAWSRVTASLTLDGQDETASSFGTRAALWGFYRQTVVNDAEGKPSGRGLLLGAGSSFDYQTRQFGTDSDRMAVLNILGPQAELSVWAGSFHLRWELAGYADFAMIDSHALGPDMPAVNVMRYTSALSERGYYFAYGATGYSRIQAELERVSLFAVFRYHHFVSIDGHDRVESALDAGLDDLTDTRLTSQLQLMFRPGAGLFAIGAYGEHAVLHGTIHAASRTTHVFGAGIQVNLVL
jgi:Domain of unknown function (DUF3943)